MAAPPLPGPLAHLAPLLAHYGYLAVGVLVFVEDFGIPAPGRTSAGSRLAARITRLSKKGVCSHAPCVASATGTTGHVGWGDCPQARLLQEKASMLGTTTIASSDGTWRLRHGLRSYDASSP
jgi:hypothetical protein